MGKFKSFKLIKKKSENVPNIPSVALTGEKFSEDDVEVIFSSLLGPNNLDIPEEDFSKLSNLTKDEKLKLIEKYNQISQQQTNVFVSKDQMKNLNSEKKKKRNFMTLNKSKCELQLSSEEFVSELVSLAEKLQSKPHPETTTTATATTKKSKRNRSISHNSAITSPTKQELTTTATAATAAQELSNKMNELKAVELVTSLRVTLTSNPVRWLREFIHFGGIQCLISLLEVTNFQIGDVTYHNNNNSNSNSNNNNSLKESLKGGSTTPRVNHQNNSVINQINASVSSTQLRFEFECVKCMKKCMDHHVCFL
jgi:hypothetical protein